MSNRRNEDRSSSSRHSLSSVLPSDVRSDVTILGSTGTVSRSVSESGSTLTSQALEVPMLTCLPMDHTQPTSDGGAQTNESPPPPPPLPPGGGGGGGGGRPRADAVPAQDVACRICQESDQPLFVWCDCKGTIGMAHKSCLEEWIARSGASRCELCGYAFHTRRVQRYASRLRSLRPWLAGNVVEQTALVADGLGALLCLAVGTGTAAVCGLGVSSLHATRYKLLNADTLFLQLMCVFAVLIVAVWFALAVRFHVRVWMRWWEHQIDIRVVPRSEESLRKAASRFAMQADARRKGGGGGGGGGGGPLRPPTPGPARSASGPLLAPPAPPPLPPPAARGRPWRPLSRGSFWWWLRRSARRNVQLPLWCGPPPPLPVPAPAPSPPSGMRSPSGSSQPALHRPRRRQPDAHAHAHCQPVGPQRAYANVRGDRYYMVDPFNDWGHNDLPYSMMPLPVRIHLPDHEAMRNQISRLSTNVLQNYALRMRADRLLHELTLVGPPPGSLPAPLTPPPLTSPPPLQPPPPPTPSPALAASPSPFLRQGPPPPATAPAAEDHAVPVLKSSFRRPSTPRPH